MLHYTPLFDTYPAAYFGGGNTASEAQVPPLLGNGGADTCRECRRPFHEHGLLNNERTGPYYREKVVCPESYILVLRGADGLPVVLQEKEHMALFQRGDIPTTDPAAPDPATSDPATSDQAALAALTRHYTRTPHLAATKVLAVMQARGCSFVRAVERLVDYDNRTAAAAAAYDVIAKEKP